MILVYGVAAVLHNEPWTSFCKEWTPCHTVRHWLEFGSVCKTWKAAMAPQAVKLHWPGDQDKDGPAQEIVPWLMLTPIKIRELSASEMMSVALCRPESSRFLLAKLAPTVVSLHLRLSSEYSSLPPLTQLYQLQRLHADVHQYGALPLRLDCLPA